MTSQPTPRDIIRQAADDATLTHAGRSIGDLASERVADAILAALDEAGYIIVRGSQITDPKTGTTFNILPPEASS